MSHRSRNIHERFLRHIWSNQYLRNSAMHASDGKLVEVLDAGELNLAGGPDFSNAKVRIDGTIYAGDVEIHRTAAEWLQHRHQNDPRYNKVILHVVLEISTEKFATIVNSGRVVPVLVLAPFLSESIRAVWQRAIIDERARRLEAIPCCGKNARVGAEDLHLWLEKLAAERLELKLRRFEERLKELTTERLMTLREAPRTWGEPSLEGFPEEIPPPLKELTQKDFAKKELWEQLLYEGMMEGLGYSKNRPPFQCLAKNVSLRVIEKMKLAEGGVKLEALLFGVAGLIPKVKTLDEEASREYARGLIQSWNEIRTSYRSEILHAADWQFFPTRPLNFPTVRIAAASALVPKFFYADILRLIIQTIKSSDRNSEKLEVLRNLFRVGTHEYWLNHYNFDEPSEKPVNPLGLTRINDIIINTVLPISLLYARIFRDVGVRDGAVDLFSTLPASANNVVTRLMDRQLIKGKLALNTASKQQAVIQLYRYYCVEERCKECIVGKAISL